ncbi:hypothetical protein L218DRAFT_1081954 [Marasmius fiardii PR-910]|nr:hypothetical protein L218DRAFT_1081954 [Marasmius fiardii PR-910]
MYFPQSNDNSHENSIVAFQNDSRSRTIPCDDGDQPIWYPVTGNIIEGLSILASITGDTATLNLLHDTIISATDSREKQRPDHIIDMASLEPGGFSTGDPFLVRGLSAAQKRNHTQGIEEDVKKFLEIQYNALLNNATFPGTNIYGGSWIGPPERKLDPIFQTYAALVLVQAITLANSTSDSSGKNESTSTSSALSGPTTTSFTQSPKKTSVRTGAIAGGVVGGVVVIAALSGLVCLFRQRRKRRQELSGVLSSFMDVWETDVVNASSHTGGPLGIAVGTRLSPQRAGEEPALVSAGEAPKSSPPGLENADTDNRLHTIPTAELARVLNARLQSESWHGDVESAPPSYPRSQFGSEHDGQ